MKCILLFSGGLDSLLSYFLLKNAGYEVKPVQFYMPFLTIKDKKRYAERIFRNYSINLEIVDISKEYLSIFFHPEFGYGYNLNPCVDCKILFLKKAKNLMEKEKADFIATGEVPGQRPFSQQRSFMNLIEKRADVRGVIFRPLAVKTSKVNFTYDESKFLNLSGRSRKPQLKLAKEFGIDPIPSPGGGCLLTDPGYCEKIKALKLIANEKALEPVDFEVIKFGRLFLFEEEKALFIVGRNRIENEKLKKFYSSLSKESNFEVSIFHKKEKPSPVVMALSSKASGIFIEKKAYELIKRYSKSVIR